jgi:hypothetical protein
MRELARRAVACRHWRWMPGMRVMVGAEGVPYRYVSDDYAPPEGDDVAFTDPRLPDLSDPATVGCLLALVREAWGDETIATSATREATGRRGWVMEAWDQHAPSNAVGPYPTEAEALVAALEAAPDGT